MKKMNEYRKPFLEEYPHFGEVVEGGGTPGAPGEDVDENPCNVQGVDGGNA